MHFRRIENKGKIDELHRKLHINANEFYLKK